ncbi:putative aminotransferase [Fimicolochytrium jonesii]|uniref:putative aminotransferase n=1 Tax=Fimicolochytrium jonesii TaxID=1396493 RepID=UPI0022FEC40E|nr:putative aminotransferase [Fimicolochytrium jonesii]KAI8816859.1 putative aminotransferase [Fimicolochytrium jonesii]
MAFSASSPKEGMHFSDRANATLFPTDDPTLISFDYGAPGPTLLPTSLITLAAAARFARPDASNALQYGPVTGDKEFRYELARFLRREYGDEDVDMERLVVTSGATQAFFNLVTIFTNPATVFLLEDPTYFLAAKMLRDHRIPSSRMVAIETDAETGIRVDLLSTALDSLSARDPQPPDVAGTYPYVLYLVPTHSNPTGSTVPTPHREEILRLARKHNILVICDDVYQLLHYDTATPPPKRLVAFDDLAGETGGNVISNCSFSKIFAPGARLGWIEAPKRIVDAIKLAAVSYSGGSPNHLTSNLLIPLLHDNHLHTHLTHLRTQYSARLTAMLTALDTHLGSTPGVKIHRPKGGYFVWVELPADVDTTLLRKRVVEGLQSGEVGQQRVTFKQGADFSMSGDGCRNALRLAFAYYEPEVIAEGVRRLALVLRAVGVGV